MGNVVVPNHEYEIRWQRKQKVPHFWPSRNFIPDCGDDSDPSATITLIVWIIPMILIHSDLRGSDNGETALSWFISQLQCWERRSSDQTFEAGLNLHRVKIWLWMHQNQLHWWFLSSENSCWHPSENSLSFEICVKPELERSMHVVTLYSAQIRKYSRALWNDLRNVPLTQEHLRTRWVPESFSLLISKIFYSTNSTPIERHSCNFSLQLRKTSSKWLFQYPWKCC
jgi:hypothetical protein